MKLKNAYSKIDINKLFQNLQKILDGYMAIQIGWVGSNAVVQYQRIGNELQGVRVESLSMVEAKAKMLLYLIEHKLVDVTRLKLEV